MPLTKLTTNLNNIQALPDVVENQATTLKVKFDKAGNDIKTYINDVLTVEADSTFATKTEAVLLTGNQTVAGVKTFSSSPIVPTPTTDMQASTKKYVDDSMAAGVGDGSVTDVKLSNGPADIKARFATHKAENVQQFKDTEILIWMGV